MYFLTTVLPEKFSIQPKALNRFLIFFAQSLEMAETTLTDWAQRWVDGRTGWHKTTPNATLQKYFPKGISRVFVPLCGKTVDLIWLVF